MKIPSNHSPVSLSRARVSLRLARNSLQRARRTSLLALVICFTGSAIVVAADIRDNPFLNKEAKDSSIAKPTGYVPSYVRELLPSNDPAPAHPGLPKPRPKRLPVVSAAGGVNSADDSAADPHEPSKSDTKPSDTSVSLPPPTQTEQPRQLQPRPAVAGVRKHSTTAVSSSSRLPLPHPSQPNHPAPTKTASVNWLRSSTASSHRNEALRLLDQAMREYNVGAWASAEASAWDSLHRSAEGIDIHHRAIGQAASSAAADLQIARTAIREARDFSGIYGKLSTDGVARIVRSHQTTVLKNEHQPVRASEAIDRYLNEARLRLSRLATLWVEAAQAMDLIAAIQLGRNEPRTLPSETSLCLRRAALQGQPGNGSLALRVGMQLADLGLNQEARWALERAMAIQPTRQAAQSLAVVMKRTGDHRAAAEMSAQANQTFTAGATSPARRVPEVTQLSPEQFASLSPSVMMPSDRSRTIQANVAALQADHDSPVVAPASYRTASDAEIQQDRPQSNPIKSTAKRLLSPFRKLW